MFCASCMGLPPVLLINMGVPLYNIAVPGELVAFIKWLSKGGVFAKPNGELIELTSRLLSC